MPQSSVCRAECLVEQSQTFPLCATSFDTGVSDCMKALGSKAWRSCGSEFGVLSRTASLRRTTHQSCTESCVDVICLSEEGEHSTTA